MDGDDPVEAGRGQDHLAGMADIAADQTGQAALRHDGDVMRGAPRNQRRYCLGRTGLRHHAAGEIVGVLAGVATGKIRGAQDDELGVKVAKAFQQLLGAE